MKKSKLKLLLALSIALLSVLSIGVSTYAWFQAQADVNISAATTETTLTVTKPDEFVFYAYKGNYQKTAWDHKGESFDDDFDQVTSLTLDGKTKFDGTNADKFHPGDVKCFALYYSNHSSGYIKLKITELLSQSMSIKTSGTKHRYDKSNSNKEINVGWAINSYSICVDDLDGDDKPLYPEYYSSFAESATGARAAIPGTPLANAEVGADGVKYYTRTASEAGLGYLNDGTYAYTLAGTGSAVVGDGVHNYYPLVYDGVNSSTDHITLGTSNNYIGVGSTNGENEGQNISLTASGTLNAKNNVDIFNSSVASSKGFIFYTLVFSEDVGLRYGEVTETSNTLIIKPSSENSRYFLQNTGSSNNQTLYNSNCYAGLTFNISEMSFDF